MEIASNPQATKVDSVPESRLEANKQTVLRFYQIALNNKDFETASKLIGPRYVQHNPLIADGIDGLKGFIDCLRETFPRLRMEIKNIFAERDFVIAHVHGVRVPGQRGSASVDIFKLEHGKIVEHWAVIQPIPDEAENPNGMF